MDAAVWLTHDAMAFVVLIRTRVLRGVLVKGDLVPVPSFAWMYLFSCDSDLLPLSE